MSGLIARRGMMARKSGGGGGLSDYVQDGLILHFDGIEKGTTPDAWTCVKSGKVFTNVGTVATNNSWICNEVGAHLEAQEILDLDYRDRATTLELVIQINKSTGSNRLFSLLNSYFCVGGYNNLLIYGCNNKLVDKKSIPRVYGLMTIAFKALEVVYNKDVLVNTQKDRWSSFISGTKSIIGNPTENADIEVYAVRFYDRELTTEEILANQKVDNIRFHLGLNI